MELQAQGSAVALGAQGSRQFASGNGLPRAPEKHAMLNASITIAG
jgi:hypothetical protein